VSAKKLIEKIDSHLRTLPPHVNARESQNLLRDAVAMLKEIQTDSEIGERSGDSIDKQITNARRRLHASIDVACLKVQIELRRQSIDAYRSVIVRHQVRIALDTFLIISASAEHAIKGFSHLKRSRHA